MTEVTSPSAPVRRDWLGPLLGIAAAMIILTVLSTAAVMLAGGAHPSATYGSGTPQQAFQSFASAVEMGDYSTADMYLSSNLRNQGVSSMEFGGPSAGQKGGMVSVDSAQINGDHATLQVTFTQPYSMAMSSSGGSTQQPVQMVLEDGGWKVDSRIFGML